MTIKRCTVHYEDDTLTIRRFDPIPPGQSPESREKCVTTENANLRRQNEALREENRHLRGQVDRLQSLLLDYQDLVKEGRKAK